MPDCVSRSVFKRILVASSPARRRGRAIPREDLWALKDIDLTIGQGEAVGIVGRNGAGKSTLLKIVAHITEPTVGVARTRGRVGALLEVGTGFHGELTGRENVFVNAAILGMSRREVSRRLDEIVDFAGVEGGPVAPADGVHALVGLQTLSKDTLADARAQHRVVCSCGISHGDDVPPNRIYDNCRRFFRHELW